MTEREFEMKRNINVEVEIGREDDHTKCSFRCPFFSSENLDYLCSRYNKYIHGYERVEECIDEFGSH